MLFFITIAIIAVVVTSKAVQNLDNYTLEQYLAEHRLSYPENEMAMRKNLFDAELTRVQEHNKRGAGWTEDLNKFSILTPQEKKRFYGRNKNVANRLGDKIQSQKSLPEDFKMKKVADLPASVDWRDAGNS